MKQIWQALSAHHEGVKDRSILSLFDDPARAERFTARAGEMVFDWS